MYLPFRWGGGGGRRPQEAAADGLHGRPDQGPRERIRAEQVSIRVQEDAALKAAQAHRNTGKKKKFNKTFYMRLGGSDVDLKKSVQKSSEKFIKVYLDVDLQRGFVSNNFVTI